MARAKKTMAQRILERDGIAYEALDYPPELRDAAEVAEALGSPASGLYKTLLARRRDGGHALAMIAADRELDLGRLGSALGEKGLRMASRAEAERWTGMEAGGISAIPLRDRGAPVLIDAAEPRPGRVLVSAGRRGRSLRLERDDLVRATAAREASLAREPGPNR